MDLLGDPVALLLHGQALPLDRQLPLPLQQLIIPAHIHGQHRSRLKMPAPVPPAPAADFQPALPGPDQETLLLLPGNGIGIRYRQILRAVLRRLLQPLHPAHRLLEHGHLIPVFHPEPVLCHRVGAGDAAALIVDQHRLRQLRQNLPEGQGVHVQEIVPVHRQKHDQAGHGESRGRQVKAGLNRPGNVQQVKQQRHGRGNQNHGDVQSAHPVSAEIPRHRGHSRHHAGVGKYHVQHKRRAVDHISHLELSVEQVMNFIGQQNGVVDRRQAPQQNHPPQGHGLSPIPEGEHQPRRTDEADAHIGNRVSRVKPFPGLHKPQKQLGYAPDHNEQLAGDKRADRPVPVRFQQQPDRRVKGHGDGRQIGNIEQDIKHIGSPTVYRFQRVRQSAAALPVP